MKNWLFSFLVSLVMVSFFELGSLLSNILIGWTIFAAVMAGLAHRSRKHSVADVPQVDNMSENTTPLNPSPNERSEVQLPDGSASDPSDPLERQPDSFTKSLTTKHIASKPKAKAKAKAKESIAMNEVISPEHKLLVLSINRSVTDGKAIYEAAR